jgi:D-beta-D-heptose 7-phosphate kinase / D-beta-D-heptose 1-phosphate adenosyltransferase
MIEYFSPEPSARVLVVGDVILDRYVHGDTSRISPEAPVPVVRVHKTEERPGGAANVAMNIRALGVAVQLIGVTGDDNFADTLSAQLHEAGVDCNFIRQTGFPTVTKLRVLSQHQQLLRLDYEAEASSVDVVPLRDLYAQQLEQTDVVVLSDYAKGSLQFTGEFIKQAREQGIRVLVDPKGNDFSRYQGASLLTPNLKEFEAIVGLCENETDIVEKAKALCRSLSLDGLLITRGGQGMSMIDAANNDVLHLPAHTHEVFDVTGAGDTVIAALAAGLASTYELGQAVSYANLAAGLVVEKLGTASVTASELNAAIGDGDGIARGIIKRQDLVNIIETARSRNERVVMTNGCFDIIHAGHVDYLQQARALGDRLLIAVNDDDSVLRLKGENRPINDLENRMLVLAALAATDWISPFSEDTPEDLIRLVKPDVLVKGADYSPEQIAGAEFVQSYGGEVVTIPFQTHCSTSDIIKKVQISSAGGGE